MSDAMDNLKTSLYLDRIPATWQKKAWPSMRPLSSWLTDFTYRLTQLEEWQANPSDIPKVLHSLALQTTSFPHSLLIV